MAAEVRTRRTVALRDTTAGVMKRRVLHILIAAASVALSSGPRVATAQGRSGVVLRFRGWRGAQARAQVVRALGDRANLVGRRDAEAAAQNAGLSLDDATGKAAIAQQLGLSFFVAGRVRGRGGRARTVIHIYDANGNELARREGPRPVGGPRLRRIRQAALAAFEEAEAEIARAEAEAAAARQAELERQRQLEAQMEMERALAEESESSPSHGLPRLQALVGLDLRQRKADVNLVDGGGRVYRAGFFPELTVELRSFPAGNADSLLRGLYAQLDLAFGMGLSTQEQDIDGNLGPEISTSAWRLSAHVGYLYALEDDSFRVGGLVGFGIDKFTIGENMTMPSSSYTYMRLGLVADARIHEELLRARIDLGFRATFGVGDLVPTFGDDSKQRGFDVGLGLYGRIELGLTYGVRFGFARYSLDFSGVAGAVPAAASAEDMTDKNISLGLQLGYSY